MCRIMLSGILLISLTLIMIFACSDPTQVVDPIEITSPDANTTWQHFQTAVTINWMGGNSDYLLIVLLDGSTAIDTLASSVPNNGSYTFSGYVFPNWGFGSDYRVQIIDEIGESGTSSQFAIHPLTGEDVFTITNPTSSTVWYWLDTNTQMSWTAEYSSKQQHSCYSRLGYQSMSYDSVCIELWKSGSKKANITGWILNTGSYTYTASIPFTWDYGSGYTIKIIDDNGNYGISSEFEISDNNFEIEIIEPTSSTTWITGVISTQVTWVVAPGSQVKIEIWKSGSYLDDYCDWTENDGQYVRSEAIPGFWGEGDNYRIKIIDDLGYLGWTEEFSLTPYPEGMEFITIPSGSFDMGAPSNEQGTEADERPVHTVTFNYSFEMMTSEVTQVMWEEVMGDNPAHTYGVGDYYPVYYVSWNDCQDFIDEMNTLDPNYTYRLPSEAEWEYTCRAGTTTRFYWGEDLSEVLIIDNAWWSGNSGTTSHPVAEKLPNAWSLYDMNGNVYEWCQDWYHSSYDGAPTNGSAWEDPASSHRVLRGGSWFYDARYCRSADRYYFSPGSNFLRSCFRLVRTAR